MAHKLGITDLPLQIYTNAMPDAVPDNQITSIMHVLSLTNWEYHGLFKIELNKRFHKAVKQLWQAVIDDDCEAVRKISIARPKLLLHLLIEKSKSVVIESKYTYQRFDLEDENILTVPVKRKQIEMIKVILECFTQLKLTDAVKKEIASALAKWPMYEIQENAIVIPEKVVREVKLLMKPLFDAFKEETFPNGIEGKLSEKTELVFFSFFNKLLLEEAVKLDNYFDVELYFLAFFKVLEGDENYQQRLLIHVMTFMQSLLPLQTAKSVYGEGKFRYDWNKFIKRKEGENIEKEEEIFHKINNGEMFCRPHRDSFDYLGNVFYQMTAYQTKRPLGERLMASWRDSPPELLNKNILEKQKAIEELKRDWQYQPQTDTPDPINVDQRNSPVYRK